jgi:hypothetical protein
MMTGSIRVAGQRIRYEDVLRWFALGGEIALAAAVAVAVVGLATDLLEPVYGTSLRFLVAVLVVTAPYAELLELRERRLRRLSLEERLGFVPRGERPPGSGTPGRG